MDGLVGWWFETPLLSSVLLACARAVLSFGLAMADVCPYEASEVCVAAGIGDLNRVKELVKENKKLLSCADYDQRSPLHIAVAEQHADIVEYLVGAGADVNITDAWGSTPLVDAMRVHNDHILAVLKKKGAKLVQNKCVAPCN